MPENIKDAAQTYFRQQAELGMPDLILSGAAISCTAPAAAQPAVIRQTAAPVNQAAARQMNQLDQIALPAGGSYDEKRSALVALYRATENCRNCPLGGIRTKYVFGSGNAGGRLMIIGDAPGEDEDRQGIPFVGLEGQLLTKMLAYIELDRKTDVFITNVLKCRPPGDRSPVHSECKACMPLLRRQIDIIAPRILLVLGRVAAQALLAREDTMAKLRLEKIDYNGIPAVVTYHPAALLRNPQYKPQAAEDFRNIRKMLKEL
jgi:DNA polymerase